MFEKFKTRLIIWAIVTGICLIPGIIFIGTDMVYKFFIEVPLVTAIPILIFGKIPKSDQSIDDYLNQDETDAFDKALGLKPKKESFDELIAKKNTAKQPPKSSLKKPHNHQNKL